MSHRVAVMHRGRIAAVLPRAEASPEQVMHYAMGLAPD
jgi:ABC-type sugar transport system ATPase subunit